MKTSSFNKAIDCIKDNGFELCETNIKDIDISHRGGSLKISFTGVLYDIETKAGVCFYKDENHNIEQLSNEFFGAFCNYLGGGLRGSISGGASVQKDQLQDALGITEKQADKLMDTLISSSKNYYENTENDMYLNDEYDENDEPNWDAIGTNSARRSGIKSAY